MIIQHIDILLAYHGRNDFAKIESKNLARYKSENFAGPSK